MRRRKLILPRIPKKVARKPKPTLADGDIFMYNHPHRKQGKITYASYQCEAVALEGIPYLRTLDGKNWFVPRGILKVHYVRIQDNDLKLALERSYRTKLRRKVS